MVGFFIVVVIVVAVVVPLPSLSYCDNSFMTLIVVDMLASFVSACCAVHLV